ncbi:hypothetical protein EV382_4090 [Micromonospora violae]|uniref:Uncharacterized protein n=1 Tax=Micromonospora violae TaxID=1278207 RepID=A0A4Q7UJZ0_9ACTN|nr:hypothetical protein EV382_4090 [Micromonospora violae]
MVHFRPHPVRGVLLTFSGADPVRPPILAVCPIPTRR